MAIPTDKNARTKGDLDNDYTRNIYLVWLGMPVWICMLYNRMACC